MKRPLFWTVMAFALGEVLFLYTDRIIQISIITFMLICCALIYMKRREYFGIIVVVLVGMILGALNLLIRRNEPEILKDFTVPISSYGIVWDVTQSSNGNNIIVRMESITDAKVMLYGVEDDIAVGSRLHVNGDIRSYNPNTNPGEFNMKKYYNAREIYFYMYNPNIKYCDVTSESVGKITAIYLDYKELLRRIRTSLDYKFHIITDEESADIYSGILLGNKGGIDTDVKQLYRINGIAHILAISGLHISIIGGMLYSLLRKAGLKFLPSGICSIFIIISYGCMTGFASATVRAVIMLSMYIWGEVIGRSYDMLTGMGLSLFIILVEQPLMISDSGMILSFTAMFGVALGIYVTNKLSKKLKKLKKKNKVLYSVLSNLIFSMSINVITIPVIAYTYFEIPLYSLFVNMLVIPLMAIVVYTGLLSLLVSHINIWLAKIIIIPGNWILKFYGILCELIMKLPYNTINTGEIHILQIIIYYACVILILLLSVEKIQRKMRDYIYKYKRIWITHSRWRIVLGLIVCVIVLVNVGAIGTIYYINKKESIVFLDVGQGDGILIRTSGGTSIVIDGGSVTNSSLGEYTLVPALKYMGMANVDYWFVTHTDEDHISGLEYILAKGDLTGIHIKSLIVSESIDEDDSFYHLMDMADACGVEVLKMDISDRIMDGTFEMICCHPDGNYHAEDKNQASLGLSYTSNAFNVLFLGDMGADALEYMVNNHIELIQCNYDVIKVPHHGSKYSIYKELYASLLGADGYAVISCGLNNRYGHPHNETLEMLEKADVDIHRTDYEGAVIIIGR